jgi:predicted RNA-binding protein YlqC (UPF0109 family)
MNELNPVREVLYQVFREFLVEPNEFSINFIDDGGLTTVFIKPHDDDIGRVIGVRGARFKAIQEILNAAADKVGATVRVRWIPEPQGPRSDRYPKFEEKADWPRERIRDLVVALAATVFIKQSYDVESEDSGPETDVTLHVSPAEGNWLVQHMTGAFQALFEAVGQRYGRRMFIRILPDLGAQPKSADGRFSTATPR